jgi:hypothetical protein
MMHAVKAMFFPVVVALLFFIIVRAAIRSSPLYFHCNPGVQC